MDALRVTLRLYGRVLARAGRLAVRNWPVFLSIFAYSVILEIGARVAVLFQLLGGFVYTAVVAVCFGSFLYLVEMIVTTSKVTLADFRRSFGVYLSDVLGVFFILWVFWMLVTPILSGMTYGRELVICLQILLFVFLNAVPELIYLGHHSAVELLSGSFRFISDNWIEWFPPNVILFIAVVELQLLPAPGAAVLARQAAVALFVYFAMVARGLLFIELYGSTRRGRAFRDRTGT